MIPEFPIFKKLTIDDSKVVEEYTKYFPYYSDFNFTSLWCWDIDHRREISLLNGNLVIKFTDYQSGEPFYSFLGSTKADETAATLLDFSVSVGMQPILRLVPEISVHNINTDIFTVKGDQDNYDYIYLIERMVELAGNQYKTKRKAVEKFTKLFPNHTYDFCSLKSPETQTLVREILASWQIYRHGDKDDPGVVHEAEAIENIFRLTDRRELYVGLVRVDERPSAFTIEEIVNNIMSIGHFWKTSSPSQGEYEFLAHNTAKYLSEKEVVYWNWEQDLGIQNLRNSKTSYRPSDFLKKFTVIRKV